MKSNRAMVSSAEAGDGRDNTSRRWWPAELRRCTRQVAVAGAAAAIVMLSVATTASAQTPPQLTIGSPSGATTTGVAINGTVNPEGTDTYVEIVYGPAGTTLGSGSPNTGYMDYGSSDSAQTVAVVLSQLTPNTSYIYELAAFVNATGTAYTSNEGSFSTTAVPTGPGSPIDPPNDPTGNGLWNYCATDPSCVADVNGARTNPGAARSAGPSIQLVEPLGSRADLRLDRSRAHQSRRSGDPQSRRHLRLKCPDRR